MSVAEDIKTGLKQAIIPCKTCEHKNCRCSCPPNSNCNKYTPALLTEEEFVHEFCHNCGSQRCEGIGTEWFDGCKFKHLLRV